MRGRTLVIGRICGGGWACGMAAIRTIYGSDLGISSTRLSTRLDGGTTQSSFVGITIKRGVSLYFFLPCPPPLFLHPSLSRDSLPFPIPQSVSSWLPRVGNPGALSDCEPGWDGAWDTNHFRCIVIYLLTHSLVI